MHHIYHTEGIILGSRNSGEAGKYYRIFTRDLGMVGASASGVRKMSSKLRYILSDFAYVRLDLVRGNNFWRVTSASKTNSLEGLAKDPLTLKILANLSRLLQKLLAGEEPNSELFGDLLESLRFLEREKEEEKVRDIEAIIVLRLLDKLGYIGENEAMGGLARSPIAPEVLARAAGQRREILSEINKALRESMLYGA